MKAPESLETLVDYGIIQEVIRPLMSGKEAQVFVVVAGGEECVAKVYKEANARTFKHRSDYTEGRRTRNTRDQRAINKRSQHGRKKDEDAWRSTEVDMIYRLRDAGVRVPEPINFVEGVLVMELVKDAEGQAAPRLGDLTFTPGEAREIYQALIREVVRMLCAGVVHGDLSDFNVLMSADGPVVIDFPQSVDPTQNPNGEKLFLRDVENLNRFLARFAPDEPVRPYGQEIWSLYQKNKLTPATKLTGVHKTPVGKADTREVMALIKDADRDEEERRGLGEVDEDEAFETAAQAHRDRAEPTPFRKVVDFSAERRPRPAAKPVKAGARKSRRAKPGKSRGGAKKKPAAPRAETAAGEGTTGDRPASNPRRRRRRARSGTRAKAQSESGSKDAQGNAKATGAEGRAKPRKTGVDGEGVGPDRPVRPRRRRRRPRKASTPK